MKNGFLTFILAIFITSMSHAAPDKVWVISALVSGGDPSKSLFSDLTDETRMQCISAETVCEIFFSDYYKQSLKLYIKWGCTTLDEMVENYLEGNPTVDHTRETILKPGEKTQLKCKESE